ncbi:MAG: heavy metal-responsive transcriptional regulator [Chloroflexi bacterium]|nr:heavy metal-responsive transcriptional regulator [Chloroflexota bacterium]
MFQIGELSAKTGVSPKTIRYYEQIGLLLPAKRGGNGYRMYDDTDAERLNFIRRARALDFALDEITEILAFRDRGIPPCKYVMSVIHDRIDAIQERIRNLEQLSDELAALYDAGQRLPEDAQMRTCVCHLIQTETNYP